MRVDSLPYGNRAFQIRVADAFDRLVAGESQSAIRAEHGGAVLQEALDERRSPEHWRIRVPVEAPHQPKRSHARQKGTRATSIPADKILAVG